MIVMLQGKQFSTQLFNKTSIFLSPDSSNTFLHHHLIHWETLKVFWTSQHPANSLVKIWFFTLGGPRWPRATLQDPQVFKILHPMKWWLVVKVLVRISLSLFFIWKATLLEEVSCLSVGWEFNFHFLHLLSCIAWNWSGAGLSRCWVWLRSATLTPPLT